MDMLTFLPEPVWYAFFGAIAIKLLELAELHKIPKLNRPDLKDWVYWIPYVIMPVLGAGLAYVYLQSAQTLTPVLALNVGVSAPLILRAMAQVNPMEKQAISVADGA